jgi:hypothetical protein
MENTNLMARIETAKKSAEKAIEQGRDPSAFMTEIRALEDEVAMRERVAHEQALAAAYTAHLEQIESYRQKAEAFNPGPYEKLADEGIKGMREAIAVFDKLAAALRSEGAPLAFGHPAGTIGGSAATLKIILSNIQASKDRLKNVKGELLAQARQLEELLARGGVAI